MMAGETVATGAQSTCFECGKQLELKVCRSNSYYLGYWCDQDGPHSRETDYFRTGQEAEDALEHYNATGEMKGMRT